MNYIFSSSVWTLRLLVSSASFHCVIRWSFHNMCNINMVCHWYFDFLALTAICLRNRQVEICKHKFVSFVFSVWNQCCFLSCAYDVPVCSFYPTVYSMTVIDVNILFRQGMFKVAWFMHYFRSIYSVVSALFFCYWRVILKTYELPSFQS